jgi:hypothetical protein
VHRRNRQQIKVRRHGFVVPGYVGDAGAYLSAGGLSLIVIPSKRFCAATDLASRAKRRVLCDATIARSARSISN